MNIKSKAFLAYLVIFLLGGATGFFLNDVVRPPAPDDVFHQKPGMNNEFAGPGQGGFGAGPGAERMQQKMSNFFVRELDLKESQREPFFNQLKKHLGNLHEMMREQRSEESDLIRNLYGQFIDDVEEILTEEQLQELNRIAHPDSVQTRRMQRRRRQFR